MRGPVQLLAICRCFFESAAFFYGVFFTTFQGRSSLCKHEGADLGASRRLAHQLRLFPVQISVGLPFTRSTRGRF